MFHRLIYVSAAKRTLAPGELQKILRLARENNARDGISGMLLYKDGSFIQLLEGEERAVQRLFDTIKADPRHSNVFVLDKRETAERAFSGWAMGYCEVRPEDSAGAGLFKLTQESLAEQFTPETPREILRFMENFYEINRG